jgi:dimethylargininase
LVHDLTNLTILTRRPGADMDAVELTHLERAPIDIDRARSQHEGYRKAVSAHGAKLIDLPPLEGYPDSVFVEDMLVALPELFIICRPGAASRRGEVASVVDALPRDRPLRRIDAPATIDGGDVLQIGRTLYVGRSTRTNEAGIADLDRCVRSFGYQVVAIKVTRSLHLKTAASFIPGGAILINPTLVDAGSFGDWPRIEAAPGEPFAGNGLGIGTRLFMQAAHQVTAARVAAAGFPVELLDIREFAKAEAGLTCMSVIIPPPAGA